MPKTFRAKVTSKGQITLPKPVRDALDLDQTSVVEFEIEDGTAVMRPARGFLSLYGSVKPRRHVDDWKRVREIAMEEMAAERVTKGR